MPDFPESKALVISELAPGLPTMFNTAFVNKGDRAMFVKVQVFSGEKLIDLSKRLEHLKVKIRQNNTVERVAVCHVFQ